MRNAYVGPPPTVIPRKPAQEDRRGLISSWLASSAERAVRFLLGVPCLALPCLALLCAALLSGSRCRSGADIDGAKRRDAGLDD